MLRRELAEREDVVLGVFEHLCDLRMRPGEHANHLGELGEYVLRVGLGEDRADDRRDHRASRFGDVAEHVAHEMHSAALPGSAGEHGADRGDQARMRVRDHQLDTSEATSLERAQERGPERLRLGFPDLEPEDLPPPVRRDADRQGDHGHDLLRSAAAKLQQASASELT